MEASIKPEEVELQQKLRAMGLEVTPLPGGRTASVELPLGEEAFEGLDGPRQFELLRFSTVGGGQIKCLEPDCFFQLPLLRVAECGGPEDIERLVRKAWRERVASLRRARQEFERLGIATQAESGGSVLGFELDGGDPHARGRCVAYPQILLPGRGPLSAQALEDPAARTFDAKNEASALDLQMSITTRLEQLAREAAERIDARRAESTRGQGRASAPGDRRLRHRVLLVGPKLAANSTLAESLRVRGYQVVTASADAEAMDRFLHQSFELMLVDANLGRSDGLELIPAIQTLAGIERLPVVLVDDHQRPQLREQAKEIGAVGYLVHPIDVPRIAPSLARLLQKPVYRRYSRYAHRVAVRWAQGLAEGFTTGIGRLGMFLQSDRDSTVHSVQRYELDLPELGRKLRVDGETVYRRPAAGEVPAGIGVRFHDFPEMDEALLIEYLRALEGSGGD